MGAESSEVVEEKEMKQEEEKQVDYDYWNEEEQITIINSNEEKTQKERAFIYESIKDISFFSLLTQQFKERIISKFKTCKNKGSSFIFKQGQKGKYFFIIKKGKVMIQLNGYIIRRLQEGNSFGELSLLYDLKRTTSIRLGKDYKGQNQYYILERKDYQQIVKQINKKNINVLEQFLNKVYIFHYLTKLEKNKILQHIIEVKFQPNERIFTRFDQPYAFFIIKQGKARLGFPERSSVQLEKYSYFGFYGSSKTEISAQALDNLVCYSIGKDKLRQLLGTGFRYFYLWNRLKSILLLNKSLNSLSYLNIEKICLNFKFREPKKFEALCKRGEVVDKICIPITGQSQDEQNDIYGLLALQSTEAKYAKDLVAFQRLYCAQIWIEKFMEHYKNKNPQSNRMQQAQGFKRFKIVKNLKTKNDIKEHICIEQQFSILFRLRKYPICDKIFQQKQIVSSINLPSITSIYKIQQVKFEQHFYYQHIEGINLLELMISQGTLSFTITKFYFASIIHIVEYLHEKNIIHRNLNLNNFLIQKKGFLNLNDLTLAKKLQPNHRTSTLVGTPHFQSPQIIKGNPYSFQVDYWSVGIIVFFLLYSKFPFGNKEKDPYDIYQSILRKCLKIPQINEGKRAKQILLNLLQKDQAKRRKVSWKQIKKNCLFRSFNWEQLREKKAQAPYYPKIEQSFGDNSKEQYSY